MLRIRRLPVLLHQPRRLIGTETSFWQSTAKSTVKMAGYCVAGYMAYFNITYPVVGRSMSPQFNPQFKDYGDTVLTIPRLNMEGNIHRGRVYIFADPSKVGKELAPGETEYLIKRCIAIEGDYVTIQRNDKLEEVQIPKGHAWLESDNHNFQSGRQPDSLLFGPIPLEDIKGLAIYCIRNISLFDTVIPWPSNYEFFKVERAFPHQRVRLNPDNCHNDVYQEIQKMKNLPNKVDMTLVPKGEADLALETASVEQKQGFVNRHKFTSSDNARLAQLQKQTDEAVEQLEREKLVPGTPITTPSKPANQSQYPNLT